MDRAEVGELRAQPHQRWGSRTLAEIARIGEVKLREDQKYHERPFQPRNSARNLQVQSDSIGATRRETEEVPNRAECQRGSATDCYSRAARANPCLAGRGHRLANERTVCSEMA